MIQGVAKPAPPESSLLHFSLLVCARSSSPKPGLRGQYARVLVCRTLARPFSRGSPPREWSAAGRCISSCHCCSLSTPTLTKEGEPISSHVSMNVGSSAAAFARIQSKQASRFCDCAQKYGLHVCSPYARKNWRRSSLLTSHNGHTHARISCAQCTNTHTPEFHARNAPTRAV